MTLYELTRLFYRLGDGLAMNPDAKVVTFRTRESARAFKDLAPDWTVQYLTN